MRGRGEKRYKGRHGPRRGTDVGMHALLLLCRHGRCALGAPRARHRHAQQRAGIWGTIRNARSSACLPRACVAQMSLTLNALTFSPRLTRRRFCPERPKSLGASTGPCRCTPPLTANTIWWTCSWAGAATQASHRSRALSSTPARVTWSSSARFCVCTCVLAWVCA